MPPYEPPDAHYAHINTSDYDTETVFMFIGKDGWRFKKLTRDLDVKYIYYHHVENRISVHGSWTSMQKNPCKEIVSQLAEFIKNDKNAAAEARGPVSSASGSPRSATLGSEQAASATHRYRVRMPAHLFEVPNRSPSGLRSDAASERCKNVSENSYA
jgi:hypothetical protein